MKQWTAVAVDDHAEILALYEAMLQASPIRLIGTATTGVGGLDLVRRERPDLLILDLGMPDMDGLEVLQSLAGMRHRPRVAVVSGFGREQVEGKCRRYGADAYFEKGISPLELVDSLEALAAQGPVPRELI